jgi:hypothetical protein
MSRQWPQDGDDARVAPNGSSRTAYDADTQTYTYQHPNGDLYEGERGSEYGPLRLISRPHQQTSSAAALAAPPPGYSIDRLSPPSYEEASRASRAPGNRRPPPTTFDEIFARQVMGTMEPLDGSIEQAVHASSQASTIPRRAMSLLSIFGSRRHLKPAAKAGPHRPSHMIPGRSTTTKNT